MPKLRVSFLEVSFWAVVVAMGLAQLGLGTGCSARPSSTVGSPANCPADSPSQITIPPAGEPGTSLVVSGRVFGPDRKTPVAGAMIYVYHTDARGYYRLDGSFSNPRLHGCVKTDAEGHYEIRTIKPGAYPGRSIPAHIHVKIAAAGFRDANDLEIQFEGDPQITPDAIAKQSADGTFSTIRPLAQGAGALLCTRDFALERL